MPCPRTAGRGSIGPEWQRNPSLTSIREPTRDPSPRSGRTDVSLRVEPSGEILGSELLAMGALKGRWTSHDVSSGFSGFAPNLTPQTSPI